MRNPQSLALTLTKSTHTILWGQRSTLLERNGAICRFIGLSLRHAHLKCRASSIWRIPICNPNANIKLSENVVFGSFLPPIRTADKPQYTDVSRTFLFFLTFYIFWSTSAEDFTEMFSTATLFLIMHNYLQMYSELSFGVTLHSLCVCVNF